MPLRFLLSNPLFNLAEGVVDSFRDKVNPTIGSVVYCDLAFGYMEHSGIYIGNNKIAHLSGSGEIEAVSPKKFLEGTTAVNIYVSCNNTNSVGSRFAADRAIQQIGNLRNYNMLLDNCHQFVAGCLTGNFENSCNFLWMLKDLTEQRLDSNNWRVWDI